MKKFFKQNMGFMMVVFALVLGVLGGTGGNKAEAATRKCYTIGTSNTRVYSNSGLSYGSGWIYSSDEITVNTVTSRYCYVTYPISGGRTKSGYIATGTILTKTSGYAYKARARITTYKRPGGASYGYIDANDSVTVFGTYGNYTQVKYPVSGGYKFAFITTDYANAYVLPQTQVQTQPQTQTQTQSTGAISGAQAKAVLFVAKYYADSYSDLKAAFGYNEAQLYNHYLNYGIREGRSASPVFDPVFYLNNNSDLKRAFGNNYSQAYNHWIQYGCSEGRSSSKYYHGYYYKNKYSDLQNAFFKGNSGAESYYQLANHYLMFGIREGRQANSNGYLPNWNTATTTNSNSSVHDAIYSVAMNSMGTTASTYQRWGNYPSGTAWCVLYATWVANQGMIQSGKYTSSSALNVVPKQAGTSYLARWFNNRGRYYALVSWRTQEVSVTKNADVNSYSPQVGDLAIIDNNGYISSGPEHTGIVIKSEGNSITLAEGNTGMQYTTNNRPVKAYTYKKSGSYWVRTDYTTAKIVGFGNPAY